MTIYNITTGQNIIDVSSDGVVTCLKIRKPIAVDWYDRAGSVGKYYAGTTDFKPITQNFNDALEHRTDAQIMQVMQDFMPLFANGHYVVSIGKATETDYELHSEFMEGKNRGSISYSYFCEPKLQLCFTQPLRKMSQERIMFYEQIIAKGARPKVLMLEAHYPDNKDKKNKRGYLLNSPQFVLDGHHKAVAYRNLNIDLEFVRISKQVLVAEIESNKDLYSKYEYFLTDHHKQHLARFLKPRL